MRSNNSGGRLPSLAHRVDSAQRDELYAKYGDLTSASRVSVNVANVARSIPMLPSLGGAPGGSSSSSGTMQPSFSVRRRAQDDMGEYVTRREFEERLAQMDMRISLLASALAQQDELSQRMQAALDEVLAKTAALPPPRPARSALSGLINDGAMLSLTDDRGRTILIPAAKIAYVEIGPSASRKVGFGSMA